MKMLITFILNFLLLSHVAVARQLYHVKIDALNAASRSQIANHIHIDSFSEGGPCYATITKNELKILQQKIPKVSFVILESFDTNDLNYGPSNANYANSISHKNRPSQLGMADVKYLSFTENIKISAKGGSPPMNILNIVKNKIGIPIDPQSEINLVSHSIEANHFQYDPKKNILMMHSFAHLPKGHSFDLVFNFLTSDSLYDVTLKIRFDTF